MGLFEVPEPVVLEAAERVGLRGGEVDRAERGAAVAVGEHRRARVEADERRAVVQREQAVVRVDVGHLHRHPPRGVPLGKPQQPVIHSSPRTGRGDETGAQFANRTGPTAFPGLVPPVAQVDRRAVGELQHHGRAPRAHALEQRLVVGQQQDGRPVGAHVVHQRRHRRRAARADQGRRAAARRRGCGRAPRRRARAGAGAGCFPRGPPLVR